MPNGFNKFNNDNQPPKKEQVSEPVPFSESVPPPKPQIKIKTVIQEVVTVKQGDQGEPGMRGLRGLRGITGPKGDTGDAGKQGKQGERGEKGEAGSQGIQGAQGVSGVAGSSGEKGEKGDRGEQGLKGDSGNEGVQGAQGEVGEKGERGEKGKQGEQGAEGTKGDTGEKGEQGESGIDGVDGQDGLLGPQGERGEDGLVGPQGEQGEKGSIGGRGEKGEAGVQGEQGPIGQQGVTGERGATGDSGIVLAKYPLRYDPKKKIISIDTTRLGGGGSVSKDGGGGGLDTAFKTVSVSGQPDLNAVQYDAEILSIVAGSNITLTTDSATNSLTISSSGSGGPTGIDSLTDVAISSKVNNDLLSWNYSTNKWVNKGVGISAGNFIILGAGGTAGTGKLPAVDGSELLEVNARYLDGKLREQITDGGVF